MRPVEALFEDGILRPDRPLNLRPGERVGLIVVRQPDKSRWDLTRLASAPEEDTELSSAGLTDWSNVLAGEDRG